MVDRHDPESDALFAEGHDSPSALFGHKHGGAVAYALAQPIEIAALLST
ncbi:MAG: hypothetical protein ACR2NB_09495 [Solirubrobacteraceae bacterium]